MTNLKGEPSAEAIALLKRMSKADYFGDQHNGHGGQNRYLAPGDGTEQSIESAPFRELIEFALIEPTEGTVAGGPPGESGWLDYRLTAAGELLLKSQISPDD